MKLFRENTTAPVLAKPHIALQDMQNKFGANMMYTTQINLWNRNFYI